VNTQTEAELSRLLATLLHGGTVLASVVVAAGLLLARGTSVVLTGIALFIGLPVLRVAVTLGAFVRRRDYPFGAIAGLVLAIIALGMALGLRGCGCA
jgi:uncharacterized membrane protein